MVGGTGAYNCCVTLPLSSSPIGKQRGDQEIMTKKQASVSILAPFLLLLCFNTQWGSAIIDPYPSPMGSICTPAGNPVTDKKLKRNTVAVVRKLVARVLPTGFPTAVAGKNVSAVYGLLQCRADVSVQECAACASEARTKQNTTCAKDGKARLWFEHCYLRYDTESFVGKLDSMDTSVIYNNGPDVPNKKKKVFQAEVGKLLREVSAKAAGAGSRGLGTGETKISPNVTATPNVTIYAMAQCTRDLSPSVCSSCLTPVVNGFLACCTNNERGLLLLGSCQIRFESYPFFNKR